MTISRPTRREFLQLGMTTALVPGLVLPANAAADPSRLALVVGNDAYPGAPWFVEASGGFKAVPAPDRAGARSPSARVARVQGSAERFRYAPSALLNQLSG